MTTALIELDGHKLVKICKNTLPTPSDDLLISKLQQLIPDNPIHLSRVGHEWYKLGGVVDSHGSRIASNLIEWSERTYIECGQNLQTLIEHTQEQNLIATRQTGRTLYFVIATGDKAEDFIQIEIDKTHEIADRWLVSPKQPPEDLEEFIDPLEPDCLESFCIGTPRYTYRRKTNVAIFMDEINKRHATEQPVQRFMDDWNRSTAKEKAVFCHDWLIRPYQNTGRFGEQIIHVDIVASERKALLPLDDIGGKKGNSLHNLLTRFDRQAGYSFAWFFHMVAKNLVSAEVGKAVYRDYKDHFNYLAQADVAILKDWISTPYNV